MSNLTDRTPPSRGVRSFFKKQSGVLLILFIAIMAAIAWYGSRLVFVISPERGEIIAAPVQPGEEWVYHYKHSVQQTPCDEYFRINGPHAMTMTHTIYQSFGVGLPYDGSEGQFISLKKDGKFEMVLNRPYASVNFRTAVQAMPKIRIQNHTYDLCKLYGQGTEVTVTVMRRYEIWLQH